MCPEWLEFIRCYKLTLLYQIDLLKCTWCFPYIQLKLGLIANRISNETSYQILLSIRNHFIVFGTHEYSLFFIVFYYFFFYLNLVLYVYQQQDWKSITHVLYNNKMDSFLGWKFRNFSTHESKILLVSTISL